MKKIHIIPTDKPSRLYLHSNGELQLRVKLSRKDNYLGNNQNIYITNDEEIKEGDWVYCTERKLFGKVIEIQLAKFESDTSMLYFEINEEEIWCKLFNCKKIILTTDIDLIKDGVQGIDDEFLEWFVKNPSCEEVEVNLIQTEPLKGFIYNFEYKIVIPKEEPKEELNLNCFDCNKSLQDCTCMEDTIDMKKETLEEAASRLTYHEALSWENTLSERCFIAGAQWQQDMMYSEEEVLSILYKHTEDLLAGKKLTLNEWFNEFKKK